MRSGVDERVKIASADGQTLAALLNPASGHKVRIAFEQHGELLTGALRTRPRRVLDTAELPPSPRQELLNLVEAVRTQLRERQTLATLRRAPDAMAYKSQLRMNAARWCPGLRMQICRTHLLTSSPRRSGISGTSHRSLTAWRRTCAGSSTATTRGHYQPNEACRRPMTRIVELASGGTSCWLGSSCPGGDRPPDFDARAWRSRRTAASPIKCRTAGRKRSVPGVASTLLTAPTPFSGRSSPAQWSARRRYS